MTEIRLRRLRLVADTESQTGLYPVEVYGDADRRVGLLYLMADEWLQLCSVAAELEGGRLADP